MNTKRNSALNRRMSVAFMAGGLAAAVSGSAWAQKGSDNSGSDPYKDLPATLALKGVVRDFIEKSKAGGHPDFELDPRAGFGHFMNMTKDALDKDGKPEFASTGYKVSKEWKDSAGRQIMQPRPYFSLVRGDSAGAASSDMGGACTSAEKFSQWYRDVPGVNVSKVVEITLVRQANSNVYSFNDKDDETYKNRNGFFPINGELFGNSGGSSPNQNFHFTYELETEFVFEQGKKQVFTFTGDDDVWVFIDGKMVIDLGGVHGATSQSVELDRLGWLVNGHSYSLKVFQAERHRTQSNFRIDTTMVLKSVEPPATTALFD